MPRFRTIKPEHWADKNLPNISLGAHLMWISMWNFSDDKGVIENDCYLIKSNSFPRRKEIKPSHIKKWIDELIKFSFVIPFEYDGIQYLIHRTFDVHQKIDKPQKSKIDEGFINQILKTFAERSPNGPRLIVEQSDSIRLKYSRVEESRVEVEEKESKGVEEKPCWPTDVLLKILIPEMLKIWKIQNPGYPADKTKDSPPLQSIAMFICEQSNINYYSRKKEDDKILYDIWTQISKYVACHSFYKKFSLQQVEKYIQTITQEIKNEQSGSKNTKTGNSKVNGQQLNTAFDKFYSKERQT